MMQLYKTIIIVTTIGLLLTACGNTTAQTPTTPPATDTPATPIQGPALISNDGAITAWEYLGHEAVTAEPSPSDKVRDFGDRIHRAWMVETEAGYELIWGTFPCSTQPVVVIAEASLDLWPSESVTPDCDAMDVLHLMTITTEITTPLDQWTLTLHPPAYE